MLGRRQRPTSEPGKKALALLEERPSRRRSTGRDRARRSDAARTSQESLPSPLAPLVLQRAERNWNDPAAAGLLTWVCRNFRQSEWPEEPRLFAEAAALLVDRFADSPGIQNFCECLGSVDGRSPSWAIKYERHLRTIVARNRDRWVLCMAKYALATVVKNSGADRQAEAEQLYESFIKRFEDLSNPSTKGMEAQMIEIAKGEIKKIRDRRKDRPASSPEWDADRSSIVAQNQSALSTTLISGSPRANRPTFSTSVARCRAAMTGE